jgi:hypothetical protein
MLVLKISGIQKYFQQNETKIMPNKLLLYAVYSRCLESEKSFSGIQAPIYRAWFSCCSEKKIKDEQ